jgi:hypothetical protein
MKVISFIFFVNFVHFLNAQFLYSELKFSDLNCHARGIISVNKAIFLSTNIGKVYKINPKNGKFKEVDIYNGKISGELRDVDFSGGKLICMESGEIGFIYVQNSRIQLGNVFLNGISFYENVGFAMGDQVDGYFSLFYTINSGESWSPCSGKIIATIGENGFAASGSSVRCINDSTFIFVTGGSVSNFYKSTNRGVTWEKYPIPFLGSESSGAFSFVYTSQNQVVVVGGNYQETENKNRNCFVSHNGGVDWVVPQNGPSGYRSCVLYSNGIYFTCGTNGLEYSKDGGKNWIHINANNYISMCFTKNELFVSTNENKIHIYKLNQFQ